MTADAAHSATDMTAVSSVVLHTSCWCCGQALQKEVPRKNRGHRHFAWRCDPCDVAWTGPGD
jgi:hypothetical protein